MSIAQRWQEVRTGFERPFWVANISEIFERLSYYAVFAALARYLHEALQFPASQAASLSGIFGGAVWVMAIFGGALADRIGFRRALSTAYLLLSVAYFLVGSISATWLAPVRNAVPLGLMVGVILFLPALGVALVKPSVVGTTARASHENVRSIGYSIYYTMVNIGSTAGPFLAGWVHSRMRVENVFRLAALSVFLMFIGVLIFFREPRRSGEQPTASLGQVGRNFLTVLGNWRFVLFLLIFSGYWIVFWQQYLILPIYIHDYVDASANTEMILIADPLMVITFTVAVNALTRRIPSFRAVTLGTVITGVAWLLIGAHATVVMAVLTLMVVALGEIIQSPRYYEYISRLAPAGQQGTYMGFAFLPIGIGSLVGGWFSGRLLHHFGEVTHQPQRIWWAVVAVGVATAALLWIYDLTLAPAQARQIQPAPVK
ncbi:MAG TPA: MFS transporter [Candidatus Angelobacter sp.]|nr:MFS transporter [Candidatus Angelobacter sp.]